MTPLITQILLKINSHQLEVSILSDLNIKWEMNKDKLKQLVKFQAAVLKNYLLEPKVDFSMD